VKVRWKKQTKLSWFLSIGKDYMFISLSHAEKIIAFAYNKNSWLQFN
jgi:hypothetical protein